MRRASQIDSLKADIAQLNNDKDTLNTENTRLNTENGRLERKVRDLEERIAHQAEFAKAKQWWQDHVKDTLESLPDKIATVRDDHVAKYLTDWWNGLAGIDDKWLAADSELRGLFNSSRAEPWRDELKEAKDRQKVLETAREAWEKWANASVGSIEDVRSRLREFSGPQQDILRDWLDETEKGGDFRLSLIAGSTPEESDEFRLFTLYVAGSQIGKPWDHTWPDGKKHNYEADADRQRPFTWKAGQSILILLETSRGVSSGGSRRNLINSVETHPLALWKLARDRKVSDGKNTVTFKIEPTSGRIPGPPPRKHSDADPPPIRGNTQ